MEHNTLQLRKRKPVTRAQTRDGWESVDNVNFRQNIKAFCHQVERRPAGKEMELNEFVFI